MSVTDSFTTQQSYPKPNQVKYTENLIFAFSRVTHKNLNSE